jgi:hypothetical protein
MAAPLAEPVGVIASGVVGPAAPALSSPTFPESVAAAPPLDRVERDPAAGLDVLADRLLRGANVAAGERLDDVPVLRDEVRVALDVPAADDLHHQVDGQLAVEARQERVPGEVDLVLVESGVRRIPLLVRDRRVRRLERIAKARDERGSSPGIACSAARSSRARRTS